MRLQWTGTGACVLFVLAAALGAQTPAPGQTSGAATPPPSAPAAGTPAGTIRVLVTPAALVYIDGVPLRAEVVENGTEISAGLHRVRIIQADYQELVRTLRVDPGETVTLSLSLADKGVRKPPAPQRGAPAGRGAAPNRTAVSANDPDLERGIQFVKEGDFGPATETLIAVTRNFAGVPRLVGQQALAFLYLGVSLVELEQSEQARRAFALAQRTDKAVSPKATEFSAEILALWEEARSIPRNEEIELVLAPAEPAIPKEPAAPAPDPAVAAASPDAEFITEAANAFSFEFFVPTAGAPCAGTLTLDRDTQTVAWIPHVDDCQPAPFTVPFAELRSPAAAPRGGVLLQFRSERPSIVVMPAPDADLLDPSVERMTVNELPPSTRVHIRRAQKYLYEALGRPWTNSIMNLLVEVPVAELLENPSDYNGGTVRTSGKLVASSNRGPYSITDENATLQVIPSGTAVALLRARGADWAGKEVIMSGTFTRPAITRNSSRGTPSAPNFAITATKIEPAEGLTYNGPARQLTLESVVKTPPPPRELVRVIGKSRGLNVFGDLPNSSHRQPTDWVIKNQVWSVWVTGKPPAGNGFAFSSFTPADLNSQWVAVTGRVEERKGFVYLRADKIELSPPPSDTAQVATTRTQSGARNNRPDINFTAPNEGAEELTRDQQFVIQFTKPMDEKSFTSRVTLRYSDGTPAAFPFLSLTFYADRVNSVMIDPGTALLPGKTIECVLLPGIKDIDNQPLVGTEAPGGRVLRWTVGRR